MINKKWNYPGAELKKFKEVIRASSALLDNVDKEKFFSPYSAVPAISQILGLNTPSMGTGDSPYSITSFIFYLTNKKNIFDKVFKIPLIEKRKIIDEIYDMIAPILLHEEEKYIDFLINIRYRKEIKKTQVKDFRKILKEKISIFSSFIRLYHLKRKGFGYIVHYGYLQDLYREFNFLEKMSPSLTSEWRKNSYPVVNEILIRNFPTYNNQTKKQIHGWIIFIPNYTQELLEDGKLRKKKILQSALLAKELGAEIIGMGGLIASFAQGGYGLSKQIPEVGFTTGHAYTIGNIIEIMDKCLKKVRLDIKKATTAVVGAAGSIGSGCAKLLAERSPKEIILVELSTFDAQQRLKKLRYELNQINSSVKISLSFKLKDIKKAGVVIVATNSPTSIIDASHLKKGAIIIDDSFPKNVPKKVIKKRDDIILLEGGMMRLPFSIDVFFSRNMPDLMDVPLTRSVSCKETYGCFAEILVLALYGYKKNYGLGCADPKLAKDILTKAKKVGFSLAPLQCFDEAIEEERIKKVAEMITKRYKSKNNGNFKIN